MAGLRSVQPGVFARANDIPYPHLPPHSPLDKEKQTQDDIKDLLREIEQMEKRLEELCSVTDEIFGRSHYRKFREFVNSVN